LAQGGKKSTFTRNLDISWWKTMVFPGFPLDFPSKGPHSPDFGPWLVRLAAAIAQVQLQLHQVHTTCDLGPWNLDGSHIQKKMLIPSDMDMFNMYIYIYMCVCLCMYIYIYPHMKIGYIMIHYIDWWYIETSVNHFPCMAYGCEHICPHTGCIFPY
jgi:hypothetical protein